MTGILDRTEDQSDRRPYYCTWSRATTYYIGIISGEALALMVLLIGTTDPLWMVSMFVGSMAFFAACAIYYDIMKRGEPVKEKEEKNCGNNECQPLLP